MPSLHDSVRFDPPTTRPGELRTLEVRVRAECQWCGEVPRAHRRDELPALLLFGWQDAGDPAVSWDCYLFCCEQHYLAHHGGIHRRLTDRPRGR